MESNSDNPAPSIIQPAPAILKGVPSIDPRQLLANATDDQVKVLTQMSFALWAASSGIEVDQRKFDFNDHRYLLPIYLDDSIEIVWQKAAQLGATIYLLLRLLWFCRYHQVKAGLYFPTAEGVSTLSKDRLTPLINSNVELRNNISLDADTLGLKQINNIFGTKSSLYLTYLGGQASKDSLPLDGLFFDEVRLVSQADIDQTLERISHSRFKHKVFMSTAGFQGADINQRFLRGTQHVFTNACGCPDGIVLADAFPNCIVDNGKEIYYRCPRCNYRIMDNQNGSFIARNPKADVHSYQVSQLNSKFISPKEIWQAFKTTTNMREFHNSKLGKPYTDADAVPINDDVLDNCINPDLLWAFERKTAHAERVAMGVDQHGGNVYVVIAKIMPDGLFQLIHFEIVETGNPLYWVNGRPVTPFKRLYEIIREFNVSLTVIDAMPNYNEAADLARTFPGRVFLSFYNDGGNSKDMILWLDKLRPKEAFRKGGKEGKVKWMVNVNRYASIDFALRLWTERRFVTPAPDKLVQVVRNVESGRFGAENIVRTRLFKHLKGVAREKTVINEDIGKFRMDWAYIGEDPHALHAMNYCTIALSRLKKAPIFSI